MAYKKLSKKKLPGSNTQTCRSRAAVLAIALCEFKRPCALAIVECLLHQSVPMMVPALERISTKTWKLRTWMLIPPVGSYSAWRESHGSRQFSSLFFQNS
jgi:hypothetical protein